MVRNDCQGKGTEKTIHDYSFDNHSPDISGIFPVLFMAIDASRFESRPDTIASAIPNMGKADFAEEPPCLEKTTN